MNERKVFVQPLPSQSRVVDTSVYLLILVGYSIEKYASCSIQSRQEFTIPFYSLFFLNFFLFFKSYHLRLDTCLTY